MCMCATVVVLEPDLGPPLLSEAVVREWSERVCVQ